MSYGLSTHQARWWPQDPPASTGLQRFALVDAGQLQPRPAGWGQWLAEVAHRRLFEGCFAEAAIDLSPVLIALDQDEERASAQVRALDKHCHALPIMSIIASVLSLDALLQHLQTLLKVEADGERYLLRLADTQMLEAALIAMTPEQRNTFFAGIAQWWVVDHHAQCRNLAPTERTDDLAALPLVLNAEQTAVLLNAVEVPVAAKQLHAYDPSFGELSHAEQMRFVQECRQLLEPAEAENGTGLQALLTQRWRERGIR